MRSEAPDVYATACHREQVVGRPFWVRYLAIRSALPSSIPSDHGRYYPVSALSAVGKCVTLGIVIMGAIPDHWQVRAGQCPVCPISRRGGHGQRFGEQRASVATRAVSVSAATCSEQARQRADLRRTEVSVRVDMVIGEA